MSLCSDAEIDIPDIAYDRFHRFGKAYNDKGTNKIWKSIIVHVSPFVIEQWYTGQKRKSAKM